MRQRTTKSTAAFGGGREGRGVMRRKLKEKEKKKRPTVRCEEKVFVIKCHTLAPTIFSVLILNTLK